MALATLVRLCFGWMDPAGTARVGGIKLSETEVLMPSASGAVGTRPLVPVAK